MDRPQKGRRVNINFYLRRLPPFDIGLTMAKLTQEQKDAIIKLTLEGNTVAHISEILKCDKQAAYRVLRLADIKPQKHPYTYKDVEGYAKTHTAKETGEHFGVTTQAVRGLGRRYGFSFKEGKRGPKSHLSDSAIKIMKANIPSMEFMEAYKEYGELNGFKSPNTFRGWLRNNDISFIRKKPGWKMAPDGHAPNYRRIDEEHLKAHAHEYTCNGYYNTFNPPCTRTTLRSRAIALGIEWNTSTKNTKREEEEKILRIARECAEKMTISEFLKRCEEELGIKGRYPYTVAYRNNIHFTRKPPQHVRQSMYTAEEARIVREKYPEMGTDCVIFLPGRKRYSIAQYASRHGITLKDKYVKIRPNYEISDYLGNKYPCLTAMAKDYNIKPSILRYRLSAGWSLKDALTLPVRPGVHYKPSKTPPILREKDYYKDKAARK